MEKRIIFIATALASCLAAGAQTPDTLRIKNVNEVTVITTRDAQTISLKGSANDPTFRYESRVSITPESNVTVRESRLDLFNWDILQSKKEQRKADTLTILKPGSETADKKNKVFRQRFCHVYHYDPLEGIGLGLSFPDSAPSGLDIYSYPPSDIFVNLFGVDFNLFYGHLSVSTNIEAGYQSFRLRSEGIFSQDGRTVVIKEVPEGFNRRKSALRSNRVALPVLLHLKTKEFGFGIYGGVELCYNFNGRIRNVYDEPGRSPLREKFTDIAVNPFTLNYRGGISFRDFSLYARYSKCPFLQEGFGPAFNTFSFGVILGL